ARGPELEERVDLEELDAGDRVQLLAADVLEDLLHDAFVAEVAIVVGILEQVAALAEQRVVDAPAVERNALEASIAHTVQRPLNLQPQPQDVPVQRRPLVYRLVGEAADLADGEDARLQLSGNRPPAFGAKVEGQVPCAHDSAYLNRVR